MARELPPRYTGRRGRAAVRILTALAWLAVDRWLESFAYRTPLHWWVFPAAFAAIAAVKQLSADVGIPANLKGILKEEDVQFLAESAYADACRPGNPRDTSVEEIAALYRSQM